MFWKKWTAKVRQHHYRVERDDLAVPEIHTDHQPDAPAPAPENPAEEEPITYDNVAIPEIHLKRKRKP